VSARRTTRPGQGEAALEQALKDNRCDYVVKPGEGAFYGPKIDVNVKDAIGRLHQLSTIQLDFSLPAKFECEYVAEDGSRKRPVVIHRAILGTNRALLRHPHRALRGRVPLWLAPEQAVIAPVSEDRHAEAAKAALAKMKAARLRAAVDWSNTKLGKKIREIAMRKVPYILVIGDREAEAGTVAIRPSRRRGLRA